MESTSSLNITAGNHTLSLVLNRPEKLNCFGIPELEAMDNALAEAENNTEIRVVVFKGAGGRAFSTGADLKQFNALDQAGLTDWIKKGHTVFNRIENYPKPTVAVVQGYALGGGLELALSCDIRIASESARFGSPELQHGWLPGWGGIHRLKKLLGQSKAKEMIYFSEQMSAEEAHQFGLVNFLTGDDHLEEKTAEILDKLSNLDPDTFAMAKTALSKPQTADSTTPPDIWFDVLSTIFVKNKSS